jgi:acyl-CoA synthetase (AMP-forming)/AMP-acid ligase II
MPEGFALSVDAVYGTRAEAFYRDGAWRTDLLVDQLDEWAAAEPEAICLHEGDVSLRVGELRDRSVQLAQRLRVLGVAAGDRVAVQLPNWHEVAIVFLAAQRLGAIMVPIMPIYRDHEVRHVLQVSGASVLVTTPVYRGFSHRDMIYRIRPDLPELREVLYARPASPLACAELHFDFPLDAAAQSSPLPPPPSPDAPALMVFTSGTEAGAKGCTHTWNTFAFSVRGIAEQCDFGPGDAELVPSPVTHTTGLIGVLKPLMYRGRSCLMPVWDPAEALELIRRHRCTHLMAATVFAQALLDAFDPATHDATSLRYFLCGGAPVPESLVRQFSERLGGPRMLTMYGQSEIVNGSLARPADPPDRVSSSDGSPLRGVELRVVDAAGQDVPPGAEGEILYRGPGGMLGYWGNPEATARVVLADGWRRTGDCGHLDADGYLRITGRVKEMVIRGGMNISILEIEELIRSHPQVNDVSVLAVPDERLGERLGAAVVASGSLDSAGLLRYLSEEQRIAKQKLPEVLHFMGELPRTATGKVQRFRILEEIMSAQAAP